MYPMRREEGRFNVGECPNCREKLIGDVDRGEIFCPKCGFVLHDQAIDQSAEWKSADYEERMKRSRVGLPSTNTLHDFGLTTDSSTDEKVAEKDQNILFRRKKPLNCARQDNRSGRCFRTPIFCNRRSFSHFQKVCKGSCFQK